MEQQKFLDTFIYETMNGKFGVSDPTEFDQIIGIYDTKTEAENALKKFIIKENIQINEI